jgi:transglutaminase-like putative cysteine protease
MPNPAMNHPPQTLQATHTIDSDHPQIAAFAAQHARSYTPREQAQSLYIAVRDGLRYDPYRIDLSEHGMKASTALGLGHGWCVSKAVVLAAVARSAGIRARLGFADVRNHRSTERLRQTMQTDVFVWHGYTELWIEGSWRKATPAFNLSLCDKFGLLPLAFDGVTESLYHPYDRSGQRHLEYVNERGSFDDLPLVQICASFAEVYPRPMDPDVTKGDFAEDAARELSRQTATDAGQGSTT